jgi:hypothetical protein
MLIDVTYDLESDWSSKSKSFFYSETKLKKLYKTTITNFFLDSTGYTFTVELSDSNGALSEKLIKANFARALNYNI